MGIRTLTGLYDGHQPAAVMIDSVTEKAFGPLFHSAEHVDDFLQWFAEQYGKTDPRSLEPAELEEITDQWAYERIDSDGEFKHEHDAADPS